MVPSTVGPSNVFEEHNIPHYGRQVRSPCHHSRRKFLTRRLLTGLSHGRGSDFVHLQIDLLQHAVDDTRQMCIHASWLVHISPVPDE